MIENTPNSCRQITQEELNSNVIDVDCWAKDMLLMHYKVDAAFDESVTKRKQNLIPRNAIIDILTPSHHWDEMGDRVNMHGYAFIRYEKWNETRKPDDGFIIKTIEGTTYMDETAFVDFAWFMILSKNMQTGHELKYTIPKRETQHEMNSDGEMLHASNF